MVGYSKTEQTGGKKKKNSKQTGEKEMFQEIWNERIRCCEICYKKINTPYSYCFAHKLAKGKYPEFKFLKENIALVCSIDCHKLIDSYYSGIRRTELKEELLQLTK